MRRSTSKSEERETSSSQSLDPTSSPNERLESPDWEMASPRAADEAKDTLSPDVYIAGRLQTEGLTIVDEDLLAEHLRQGNVSSETGRHLVHIVPDASKREYGENDQDEDTARARRNYRHSCEETKQVCPMALEQESISRVHFPTSPSKVSGGKDEATASRLLVPLSHIDAKDSGDYTASPKCHLSPRCHLSATVSPKSATFPSQPKERESMIASSTEEEECRVSRFDRPQILTRSALLGQEVLTTGSETALGVSKGLECEQPNRPPKRQLKPFWWRLRKKAPTNIVDTSSVSLGEGKPEDEASDAALWEQRALTSRMPQAPDEVDTASRSLSLTPSPPSTLTGRSASHSWVSALGKRASGRKAPKATTFFSLLKRASNSSPREKPVPIAIGRLSVASDIEWDCDNPEAEAPSSAIPGTLGTSGKERKSVHAREEGDDSSLLKIQEFSPTTDPYEVRTSSRSRLRNLKDAFFGSGSGKRVTAMIIASAMILTGVLIAAAVLTQSATYKHITLMHLADDLRSFCTAGATPVQAGGCLAAVEQLSHAMDWSADPCLSLDEFVCGHWYRWNPERGTYKEESTENLTTSIHETFQHIVRNLDPGLHTHEEKIMAVFYNSCRSFVLRRDERIESAADLMSALGLQRITVANNESVGVQPLVNFVVGTSLRSGLPSVIRVASRAGIIYVDVGRSLRSTLGIAHVDRFLRAALNDMGLSGGILNQLLSLDDNVHSILEEVSMWEPFRKMSAKVLARLAFFDASFVKAVNHALPNGVPVHTAGTVVSARCLSEIQETLATVAAENARTAYVYTSLVLVAQVRKYAYILVHGVNATEEYATKKCVKMTGNHFKALFPHWVTYTFVGLPGIMEFHAMKDSLREAIVRSPTAMELQLNRRDLDDIPVILLGERNVSAWPPTSPAGIPPTDYDHRFLLNVVRASRDAIDTDYEGLAIEKLLRGDIVISSVNPFWAVFVPANFLVGDMAYASSAPEVSFSTLGVWLSAQWIRAAILMKQITTDDVSFSSRLLIAARTNLERGVPTKPEHARCISVGARASSTDERVTHSHLVHLVDVVDDRAECTRLEASAVLGRNVSRVEALFTFFMDWGLDVAFAAAEAQRRELTPWWARWKEDRRSRQLFLMRFCQTMCGDEAAVETCRYHAMQSQDLASAFRCDA